MSHKAGNPTSKSPPDTLPLSGLRVLDLSQVMAGPYCCMLLGDMGADVIKVEPPEAGDQTRKAMGFRMKGQDSPGFLALNRNKRSITINLKSDTGRKLFYALVRTADIVVENSRPGVAAKLGVDYETLREINPRIIYASISGFGQTGPWAQRPGFDLIAQAMSGVMSAMGIPGEGHVKSGVPIGDLGAGLLAIYGILSAVIGREKSGEGQFIDASLFEAALGLSIWETTEYWATGISPQPLGTANRMSAPYQAFSASDGHFVVGAANQKLWLSFCNVIDRPDLLEDPRFFDNRSRLQNRAALVELLAVVFLADTVASWVNRFLEAGVPAGPINDYAEVLQSDHVSARKMVIELDHPVEGTIRSLGFPVKLSATPQQVRRHPPLLGEHNLEIIAELGLEDQQGALRDAGAFSK
ncbi:CaiB/BaiF CoA-transferase family protein [Roseinatronobacter sp. S2]|uniref:CaiB/BaiF CoA transferase family protein n=1 Tax=Roseinatronobacter sp. S2 TaxID=3035471 RepID=UPI00240ECE48|nr:CoA transferase [Roseinatronobacter sp. S2]WFE76741.1 CoA transferase [Roseinatronobacter sp. S2]